MLTKEIADKERIADLVTSTTVLWDFCQAAFNADTSNALAGFSILSKDCI